VAWIGSGAGAALILLALRDIFHTLGHPEGQGVISRFDLRAAWRISRIQGRTGYFARTAGPLALLAVVGVWALLAVIGWTLIYWPFATTGLTHAFNPAQGAAGNFWDSFYLSMVTISTLGFGDIVPVSTPMRIVTPLGRVDQVISVSLGRRSMYA
jgi:hypothetical protein